MGGTLDDTGSSSSNGLLMPSSSKNPRGFIFKDVFKMDELGLEIARIAFPAALALAADPIASLVDTGFMGHMGPVELGAVGVSIAVFNQVSKVTIFPLVSVTTSFVAEEDAAFETIPEEFEKGDDKKKETIPCSDPENATYSLFFCSSRRTRTNKYRYTRKNFPSVSSALLIGGVLGLLQAIILIFGAKPILIFMGIKPDSPMMTAACQYLKLRSLGAPPVLLSLAMQGIFRGFKDTKTPLFATVVGDATIIILDPILMFFFQLGVSGAAISHVISQYLNALILLWRLTERVDLLPPSLKDLQFSRFMKNGLLLLVRVISVSLCVTLAASMAARQGPISMAAFQICLQIWLATSLLADGLAVAGQAILASSFTKRDHCKAKAAASRVLQLGMILGLILSAILGIGLQFGSKLFTRDVNVLQMIHIGIPFVAVTQPINALSFVFDGINYGASDFAYSAYSMVLVATASIVCLYVLSSSHGFVGIWIALTIYMSLRMFAGFWRIGAARGPWSFLRD